jgi:type IV pilus assembly protein PilM
VQALGSSQLRTNLLPEEIVTTRLVKAKKPWAVAAAALLLAGFTINYFGHYSSLMTADTSDPQMAQELTSAKSAADTAKKFADEHTTLKSSFEAVTTIGNNLQSNVDGRLLWLEVLKAVDAALPKDTRPPQQRQETEEDIAKRPELHIQSMDCEYFADLTPWQTSIAVNLSKPPAPAAPAVDAAADGAAAAPADGQPVADPAAGPAPNANVAAPQAGDPTAPATDAATEQPVEGEAATGLAAGGWVIELRGYHLHNNPPDKNIDVGDEGEEFVRSTFIKYLETGKVTLPDGPNGQPIEFAIADLGIQYPVVVTNEKIKTVTYLAEPVDAASGMMPMGARGLEGSAMQPGTGMPGEVLPKTFKLRQYDFVIQFCWQPQPRGQRLQKMAGKKAAPPEAAPAPADGAPPATAPAGTAAAGDDAAQPEPSS